jgi:hypothetical protein
MACGLLMPALLTRMSILPSRFSASTASALTAGRSAMSATIHSTLHAQACADFRGGSLEFFRVAAGDEDIGARFGETACHRFAKTFAAAGDEGGFA